jgi:beta-alanine--pyruvate transaminase
VSILVASPRAAGVGSSRRVRARGYEAMDRAFHDEGLMIRIAGDTIALTPPLIVSEAQIGEMVHKVARAIGAVV